jgi:hypothetical protein
MSDGEPLALAPGLPGLPGVEAPADGLPAPLGRAEADPVISTR